VEGIPAEDTSAAADTAWAAGCSLAAGRRAEGRRDRDRPWEERESRSFRVAGRGLRRRLGVGRRAEGLRGLCRPSLCGLVGRLVGGTEASVVTLWGSGSGVDGGRARGGFAPGRVRWCRF
jgi:hypothetical protein